MSIYTVNRFIRGIIQAFSNKISDTEEYFYFDMTDLMIDAGYQYQSITAATISIEVVSGVDATPENILSGSPSFINNVYGYAQVVRQKLVGGVNNVKYKLTCTVTTPTSVAPLVVYLTVQSP